MAPRQRTGGQRASAATPRTVAEHRRAGASITRSDFSGKRRKFLGEGERIVREADTRHRHRRKSPLPPPSTMAPCPAGVGPPRS